MHDSDVEAKLQVLDEIKKLMDERLKGKFAPEEAKGLEIEKVSVLDGEGEEMPMEDDGLGMEMDEKEKLKAMYEKMLG